MSYIGTIVGNAIAHWGYIAVFVMTALEGFGFFFIPGETTLMAAAIVAGHTGRLDIIVVLLAAICGAIIGDNFAFLMGRHFGFPLLRRYGHIIHVDEKRLKFIQYLFLKYGKPIVFIGRFVVILRAWEAFLAGANALPWRTFAPVNAAAIVVWACVWGLGAWAVGQASKDILVWLSIGILIVIVILLTIGSIYYHRHEEEFEAKAEEALPGPLHAHRQSDLKPTPAN